MHQSTLDGIPQPQQAPRRRGGRPRLTEEQKPIGRHDISVYKEDEEALRVLRAAGYGNTAGAIMRKLARERAAEIEARGSKKDDRLAL